MENANQREHCVICGKETPYLISTHIDYRIGYVEGVGQLCRTCTQDSHRSYANRHIAIDRSIVESTPNDFELGAKIRKQYYDSANND